ncbi:MAG: glucosamine-6-phosphate deaminase [Candidatus Brockarchaeota archaeon]|nr:glucosamine-6-phosphate deaminase [Candidatus Brockarchaeota archaeon]
MKLIVVEDYKEMSRKAASIVADEIRKNKKLVLGLATGGTPLGLYGELIRMHKEEKLDFSGVKTFNLDEYLGLDPDNEQSYHYFMFHNFFNYVNVDRRNVHIPDGKAKDPNAFCVEYERMIKEAGGIDLQILGIGSNGHIAFNEPGSKADSRTRVVDLSEQTIRDNARFFKDEKEVPRKAISMGIGTIMEAKKIVLLASGKNKADAIAKTVEGMPTEEVPASLLQRHRDVTVIVDKEAASKLTRRQ